MPSSDLFSVERIAELARIDLNPVDGDRARQQLDRILDFIAVLDELELDDVEPFFGSTDDHFQTASSLVRPDAVNASTPRDDILRNAPDHDGEFYHVPPVFD